MSKILTKEQIEQIGELTEDRCSICGNFLIKDLKGNKWCINQDCNHNRQKIMFL